MAIITCPHCGKQITDRMETCPHCNAVLMQHAVPESLTKENIKDFIKDGVIGGVAAIIFTGAAIAIWYFIALIYVNKFMGSDAGMAVTYSGKLFFSRVFFLLPLCAVIFWGVSVLLKRKPVIQLIVGFVLTVLLATVGYLLQNNAIDRELFKGNIPPQIVMFVKSLTLGYGFALPMFFGSLLIASYDKPMKRSLLIQALMTVGFVVLAWVLGVLLLVVFAMGTNGVTLASFITAIFLLVLSGLLSKGFRQIIMPKKIV